MALSNTAVPKYYGIFREQVLQGKIPVCHEISMQMNRIDERIVDPMYYYDAAPVDGFIKFCETEMTKTDGSPLTMLPSFKLWIEDLLGWYYFVDRSVYTPDEKTGGGHYVHKRIKKRLCNKQYLIVARGAAKSMYASFIQAYYMTVDQSTTHQIVTAPTMKQAEETMSPFRTALNRAPGPVFKFMTEGSLQNTTGSKVNRVKLTPTKAGIQNFLTNSLLEVRPMTIDKLQGMRPRVSTVDEWLSGDLKEDVVGAIEQGASKMEDYIIVATSSEGTVRNGPGDEIKMEVMKVLKGDYQNPHMSVWYYRLDDISEVGDPSTWLKANPNLGLTVSYETYQLDVERAEQNPSARNDILAKRFGIPLEGYTYFFTYEETIPHKRREFWEMPASMGIDLSQGDDFCSFTFLFPIGDETFGVKTRNYISDRTMTLLPGPLRFKYEDFLNEGSLCVMPGNILDLMEVYEDLEQFIEDNKYDIRSVGFDPYNAREFVERWAQENGNYAIEKVPQGAKTESVPLGEIKILANERRLLFDEEIMMFTMGNCITIEDTNGNRKLMKKRYENKIDCVAALMDAWISYKLHKEEFE